MGDIMERTPGTASLHGFSWRDIVPGVRNRRVITILCRINIGTGGTVG
jgi:hypothetical protein